MRRLFFAVTTCALACGLVVSDWPLELKGFALCVPAFWGGMAALFLGATMVKTPSIALQILGEYIMGLSFALAFTMIMIGSIAALAQIILLIVHFVA